MVAPLSRSPPPKGCGAGSGAVSATGAGAGAAGGVCCTGSTGAGAGACCTGAGAGACVGAGAGAGTCAGGGVGVGAQFGSKPLPMRQPGHGHRRPVRRRGRRRLPRAPARRVARVLRVPGRRGVVDGELTRQLGGLRVGLIIDGNVPAPVDLVPIAVHFASWCGRAPLCRRGWGATSSSDRPGSPPVDAATMPAGSPAASCPTLIVNNARPAGPAVRRPLSRTSRRAPN